MPNFAAERRFAGRVAGIDEAGRAPLAGPVVAAAVVIHGKLPRKLVSRIDDSKRLARPVREELYHALRAHAGSEIFFAVGAASATEIDRLNIHHATLLAMRRAVLALPISPDAAIVDGKFLPELPCPGQAIVGGDGTSVSIAAASIIAKVTRDRIMERLALRHPGFGWERNAGYGTPEHQKALTALGPTPHHRRSFQRILNMLSPGAQDDGDILI